MSSAKASTIATGRATTRSAPTRRTTSTNTTPSATPARSSTSRRSSSTACPVATRHALVDRIITRDPKKMAVGQVYYTPWCDEDGKVIDDGTVTRVAEQTYRWTAADPNLRWLTENAAGLDVRVEDISEQVAALALQGPTSAAAAPAREHRANRHAEVLPVCVGLDCRRAGRHLANRLHRRSRLRGLDAVGCRHSRVGRDRRRGPRLRSASDGHAGARRRARRSRPAAHRRRLSQQPQGDDRSAEVFALRARPGAPRRLGKGPFVGRAALAAEQRRGPRGRSSASRSTGPRSNGCTRPWACRRRRRPRRRAWPCRSTGTAARSAARRRRRGRRR